MESKIKNKPKARIIHNIRKENLTSTQIINIMNADKDTYIDANDEGERCIYKKMKR